MFYSKGNQLQFLPEEPYFPGAKNKQSFIIYTRKPSEAKEMLPFKPKHQQQS